MSFDLMQSHGFYQDLVEKDKIKEIKLDCLKFLNENKEENYFGNISEHVNNIDKLINPKISKKISQLLDHPSPELAAIELHVQKAKCEEIPPHQDNFYHQVHPLESLKILIPLQELNTKRGGLLFLDCDNNFEVLHHNPSKVKNFSSYIPSNVLKKFNFKPVSYSYKIGDFSYHFVNSIHFSYGNKTDKDSLFIVYRYQVPNQVIDENLKKKYDKCYQEHKKLCE